MSEYEVPFTTTNINIKVEETKSNNDMDEPTKENQEQPLKLKDRKVKEFINNIVETTLQTEAISEDQLYIYISILY